MLGAGLVCVCVCASFHLVNLNVIDNECVATLLTLFSFSFSHRNYYDLTRAFFLSFFLSFAVWAVFFLLLAAIDPLDFNSRSVTELRWRINEREESPPTIN